MVTRLLPCWRGRVQGRMEQVGGGAPTAQVHGDTPAALLARQGAGNDGASRCRG